MGPNVRGECAGVWGRQPPAAGGQRGLGRSPSRGPGDRVPGQGVWGAKPPRSQEVFLVLNVNFSLKFIQNFEPEVLHGKELNTVMYNA